MIFLKKNRARILLILSSVPAYIIEPPFYAPLAFVAILGKKVYNLCTISNFVNISEAVHDSIYFDAMCGF